VEPGTSETIDARELRAAQGTVAILLLGAFVFRVPQLVVGVTVVVTFGAVLGPRFNAFHGVYRAIAEPRLRASGETVAARDARALDVLATGILVLATAALAVNFDLFAWFLTVVEAAIAVVTATTGFNTAIALRDRMRRDR
jgi:hypothetical protein